MERLAVSSATSCVLKVQIRANLRALAQGYSRSGESLRTDVPRDSTHTINLDGDTGTLDSP